MRNNNIYANINVFIIKIISEVVPRKTNNLNKMYTNILD